MFVFVFLFSSVCFGLVFVVVVVDDVCACVRACVCGVCLFCVGFFGIDMCLFVGFWLCVVVWVFWEGL